MASAASHGRGRPKIALPATNTLAPADTTTAPVAVTAGANVLVAGSAIFGQPQPWEAAEAIRAAARAVPGHG